MLVFILNKKGEALMPCSTREARLLLRDKTAKIVNYKPFTIRLLYGSSGYTQETNLGIDTGAKSIGVAATSGSKVLIKGQIDLRQDVSKLLETRKMLRRSRRNRKKRYRPVRFLNRKTPKEWLPPSIQSRLNNIVNWINKFYKLLPKCKLHIEVGKFNIQKIENSSISGKEYQQGEMYNYRNRIAYLLAREKGVCQYCKTKYDSNNKWRLHHIWGKSKDRPKDWALVHESCHKELHLKKEEGVLRRKKSKSYKESTFMNIIRKRMYSIFPDADFTYGNITFQDRCNLDLEKTHYNDAIAISSIKEIIYNPDNLFYIRQFRKKKRSLQEANARKGIKNNNILSKRNKKNTKEYRGLFLNDKVKYYNFMGFISGFTYYGCYIKDIQGSSIKKVGRNTRKIGTSKVRVLEHNNNWQYIPYLKENKEE